MTHSFNNESLAFAAFTQGNERGLSYYFDRYYSPLLYYAVSLAKEQGVSEEIVSEAFLRLWKMRDIIKEEGRVKNLLYTIVRHLCFDHLRKEKTASSHLPDLFYLSEKSEPSRLETIAEAESFQRIYKMLNVLPPRCRQIFQAYYFHDKSLKEIAKELNISVGTVKSRKHHATSLLKKLAASANLLALQLLMLAPFF